MPPRRRHAGVLLHPTSLPGPGPIGEIGPYAHAFLEWMVRAGLDVWQMLPLHPVGPGNSPYTSSSAFAADPRLISVEALVADGLLEPMAMPWGKEALDADVVDAWKMPLLRAAAARVSGTKPCRDWVATQAWMADWGLFAALEDAYGGGWQEWPAALRDRKDLADARRDLADAVAVAEGLQYLFHVQWTRLRDAAAERGIRLLGDVPIFVSGGGCDTWAHRDLFRLDADGNPDPVAGVPPDYFSVTGQRWGNPVYAWKRHAATGFAWWKRRLRRELDLTDSVRLDHFRGFCANWCVPAEEEDARHGRWEPGPGKALFDALADDLGGELPLVAEDLGEITPDVVKLREDLALPGMKILQFAFGGDAAHPFLPHNFQGTRWVAYTGTHDNDTIVGWYQSTDERTRHRARVYCGRDLSQSPAWPLMREVWASVAETAVAPMQDILGLPTEARFNTPGQAEGNWTWRLRDLPWDACGMMRGLGETFGRAEAEEE